MKVRNVATSLAWKLSWAWLLVCAGGLVQEAWASGAKRATAIVSGSVRDNSGRPVGGAVISLVREGMNQAARRVRSTPDGSFRTRILPGRYLLSALATGFEQVSFGVVNARQAQELVYRFNLTPVGTGRTLPEMRRDKDSSKWVFRSVFGRRSIFQIQEEQNAARADGMAATDATGDLATGETAATPDDKASGEVYETAANEDENATPRRAPRVRGVVETYFVSSAQTAGMSGVNFALATPVSENITLVFAGQTGTGAAPQRLETTAQVRLGQRHKVTLSAGAVRLNTFAAKDVPQREMGQISFRAFDEWTARDGIVVVLGLDYARFVGTGANATHALKPRLGLQFDLDAKTRVHAGLTSGEDLSAPGTATQLGENDPATFRNQAPANIAFINGQPNIDRSRRLEFGLERVLDNSSSIEATVFMDTSDGRGVGLLRLPLSTLKGAHQENLTGIALQEGAARGLRVVYTRRVGSLLTTSAGYAVGRGQRFNAAGINNPAQLFTSGTFQTAAVQVGLTPWSGTNIHTVLRFSPRATIFAIDPLAGRLAVYDPSLSFLLTQELPTFGLPVRAEAIIDARNLLDLVNGTEDGEQSLSLLTTRRSVRGGIALRF